MPLRNPPVQEKMNNTNGTLTQTWLLFFNELVRNVSGLNPDGSLTPPVLADAEAANGSIYYSSTQNTLVYKDSAGVVNDLY